MIGKTISHYQIVDKLGEGGMGEVYRARDTRLKREVALKILPPAFAGDADRMARFEREAQVLASLNHPHIAQIHGIEEVGRDERESGSGSGPLPSDAGSGFTKCLVLELVEGETLAERIARGVISLEDALNMALQVAEGLEAAHEKGIIHRDLKPANIKIAPQGQVKILDFGLAKALEQEQSWADPSHSPTLTRQTSETGVILGTAAYMSPEQARGQTVDRRADIWAFGCLLLEMLTGRQAFEGKTGTDVLAAVITREPDWSLLPAETPPAVRRLLSRCLDKKAHTRLRDIGEARVILSEGGKGDSEATVVALAAPARSRSRFWWPVAGVTIATLGFLLSWSLQAPKPLLPERKYSLAPPFEAGGSRLIPRISPNGEAIAYLAEGRIWIQNLNSLTASPVTGSEGASFLAWSPDGSGLAFTVLSKLWRIRSNGELVFVADLSGAIGAGGGITWSDDHIVYATGDDHLFQVPVSGGTPAVLLERDGTTELDLHWPAALPQGRGILFVPHQVRGAMNSIELLLDGERRVVFREEGAMLGMLAYSYTGHILFERTDRSTGLWALPFSLSGLQVSGEPFLITGEGSEISAARDGSLLYSNMAGIGRHRLTFVDRQGQTLERVGGELPHADNMILSPDGSFCAVCIIEPENSIWVFDIERGTRNLLSSESDCGGLEGGLAWAPDGQQIAYTHSSSGELRLRRTDGSTEERSLTKGKQPAITSDGRFLVFSRRDDAGNADLWYLELDANSGPELLLGTKAREEDPRTSPTDNLLAYVSNESGRDEVYLRTFPQRGKVWKVSVRGGAFPRWSDSGRHLYYLENESVVMEVEISTSPTLRLSNPQQVFTATAHRLGPNHGWDVVGEGEKFLMVDLGRPASGVGDLTLVTNWRPDPGR